MNGIIYARVSSIGQLSGHGIKRQIECCLDYAKKNNINVLSILTECCSGSDPSKMLVRNFAVELAEAKSTVRTPCKILVEARDRWSRSGLSDPLLHYKITACSEIEIDLQKKLEMILTDFKISVLESGK
jgi:DNA invertase Pin-like site-specific DNA recombinase